MAECRECGSRSGPFRWVWKADESGALQRHQAVCWSHRGESGPQGPRLPSGAFRSFRSGICLACGQAIAQGEFITKDGYGHYHAECPL